LRKVHEQRERARACVRACVSECVLACVRVCMQKEFTKIIKERIT